MDRQASSGPESLGQVKPVLYVDEVKAITAFFRDVLGFALLNWAHDYQAPYPLVHTVDPW